MNEGGEAPVSADYHRGMVTDRGLTWGLNMRDGHPAIGSLDMLGLTPKDLVGLRVLDVGPGGGRSLRQARELEIDYYGADVLPVIDPSLIEKPAQRANVLKMQPRFKAEAAEHPGRLIAADFAKNPAPYPDDFFDLVISAGALPGYARDATEAVRSLVNMIRVSRKRVVCGDGWLEQSNPKGIVKLGAGPHAFGFAMKAFLDSLKEYGITYRLLPDIDTQRGKRRNPAFMNLDLDVSQKDSAKLAKSLPDLLASAGEFQAEE